MSTAHCYEIANIKTIAILSGTDIINNYRHFSRQHSLDKIIQHEHFNSTGFVDNDIALARVLEPFEWSFGTGPINLPYNFINQNLSGRNIFIMGFGHTLYKGYNSGVLLKADLLVGSNNACKAKWLYEYDSKKQMCMVPNTQRITDACQNDSGGPVVLTENKDYLIAIVSFGDQCGKGYPAVNVRVTAYLEWIETNSGFKGETQKYI